jgi:molybdopterin-guanine dinucleotide biosynthesis protein A
MNGYILAGGKSSRMGIDKGLLYFGQKQLVEYAIHSIQNHVDQLFIITKNKEYEKFGFTLIEDITPNLGPAGGIFTALIHSETEKNLIIGCDMPFISDDLIQQLSAQKNVSSISIFKNNAFIEPLFGIYSKSVIPIWKDCLDQNILKLEAILSKCPTNYISFSPKTGMNPFANINSKEDIEKYAIQIKKLSDD